MTEEEKQAIADLKKTVDYYKATKKSNQKTVSVTVDEFDVDILETLFNLIENQDNRIKELEKAVEKRGEIIDRMADYMITGLDDTAFNIICKKRNCSYKFYDNRKTSRRNCENCIKEYFEKKDRK